MKKKYVEGESMQFKTIRAQILLIGVSICTLAPALIGYLQYMKSPLGDKIWPGIEISLGEGGFNTLMTAYSMIETAVSLVSGVVIVHFLREILKDRTLNQMDKGQQYPLEKLTLVHSAVTSTSPAVAMVSTSAWSVSAFICCCIFIFGISLNLYKTLLPITVVRYNEWEATDSKVFLLKTPTIRPKSFQISAANPVNFQNNVNQGSFRSAFYFSKLPIIPHSYFGFDIDLSSVSILGQYPSTSYNQSNIISVDPLPVMKMDIVNWKYQVIDPTFMNKTHLSFLNQVTFEIAKPESSMIQFIIDLKCVNEVDEPWKNCNIPNSVDFKLIQRLPRFGGTYDRSIFTTDVFWLANSPIPPEITFPEKGYVLTGSFVFNKTYLQIYREKVDHNLTLVQYPVTKFNTEVAEKFYNITKIASLKNIEAQFNSGLAGSSYYWMQLKEFVISGELLYEFRDYKTSDFVNELKGRLLQTIQFWLKSMVVNGDDLIPLPIRIGVSTEKTLFGVSLIAGLSIMVLWLTFLLLMVVIIVFKKWYRKRQITKKSSKLQEFVHLMWEKSYGIALIKGLIDEPAGDPQNAVVTWQVSDLPIASEPISP